MKINKKGFTLLELLVVVLIIGMLAAIALPQYRKVVEKSKLSDALITGKSMRESVERYFLSGHDDLSGSTADYPTVLDIDLTGGEWLENVYVTDNFKYEITGSDILAYRNSNSNYYVLLWQYNPNETTCYNGFSEMGTYICHYLESQGWKYIEGDI